MLQTAKEVCRAAAVRARSVCSIGITLNTDCSVPNVHALYNGRALQGYWKVHRFHHINVGGLDASVFVLGRSVLKGSKIMKLTQHVFHSRPALDFNAGQPGRLVTKLRRAPTGPNQPMGADEPEPQHAFASQFVVPRLHRGVLLVVLCTPYCNVTSALERCRLQADQPVRHVPAACLWPPQCHHGCACTPPCQRAPRPAHCTGRLLSGLRPTGSRRGTGSYGDRALALHDGMHWHRDCQSHRPPARVTCPGPATQVSGW